MKWWTKGALESRPVKKLDLKMRETARKNRQEEGQSKGNEEGGKQEQEEVRGEEVHEPGRGEIGAAGVY